LQLKKVYQADFLDYENDLTSWSLTNMNPFWVLILISNVFDFLVKAHEYNAQKEKECPRGWKSKQFVCYEDSHMEFSFDEALLYCLNQQDPESGYWNGHYYGLVSVGQLRHFRNRYDFGPSVDRHQHYFDEQRMFRVNGRKDNQGVWREYITGNPVPFHHYPGFNQESGHVGETLIWDSKTNRLYTTNVQEKFHALCTTRPKNCPKCPNAEWLNECSNSGDCLDGVCQCDVGFEGLNCQIPPLEDTEKELLVFAGSGSNPSEKFDFETNTTCILDSYPTNQENVVFGEAFGHVFSCGGNQVGSSATNQCWKYHSHHHSNAGGNNWAPIEDMMNSRSNAAAVTINDGRRDMAFWVTFGEDEQGNDLNTTEIYTWYGDWIEGPAIADEYKRKGHCTVQINHCEAAVLGGVTDDTTFRDDIVIFNFEDAKWKQGPSLRVDRANLQCAKIQDSTSEHPIVISACGIGPDGVENVVEKWDLYTYETEVLPFTCPVDYFSGAWAISDHEIIFVSNTDPTGIWSFTLDYGFRKISDLSASHLEGGSTLLPKHTIKC